MNQDEMKTLSLIMGNRGIESEYINGMNDATPSPVFPPRANTREPNEGMITYLISVHSDRVSAVYMDNAMVLTPTAPFF